MAEIKKVKVFSKLEIVLPRGFARAEENVDIIIMDVSSENDAKLCRTFTDCPVIIISDNADLILKSQATDFIFLPVNQKELEIKLELVSRKLNYLFNIDPLTKAHNKEYLYQICNEALNKKIPFSILMLDIDSFKQINDFLGHLEGDKVLQKVATSLEKSIRDTDILARFGGDEFIIMLQHADKFCAKNIAGRIKENCREICKISIGVASSSESNNLQEIIDKADKDLYKAKRSKN